LDTYSDVISEGDRAEAGDKIAAAFAGQSEPALR
jgi:hypothetical protein